MLTCPTEWGGFTHRYFIAPRTVDEQVAARDAIAAWSRITYGWLGRSPDYKAAFLATLGANADFYIPYQENARRWYRLSQERVPFINHAIIHPPVDRNMAPGAAGGPSDVYVHVTKETDAGIRVSGAKVVATGSALTHYTFIAHHTVLHGTGSEFRPRVHGPHQRAGRQTDLPRLQRAACRRAGKSVRLPAVEPARRERCDLCLDDVLIPWENVFVYGDIEKANNFFPRTGFVPRAFLQGSTRLGVKLDFIAGLFLRATELTGTRAFRGVEANLGEVIAWRNMIWSLSDAMAKSPDPWENGYILPGARPAMAYTCWPRKRMCRSRTWSRRRSRAG